MLEAANGQEAVAITRRQPLDLILINLRLPVLDGFEAICLIREDLRLRDIPIVAVTAQATAEDRIKVCAAGFNEYVTKPLDFEKLANLINGLLHGA